MIQVMNDARLSQFFYPVSDELGMVENELNNLVKSLGINYLQDFMDDAGNVPDKYLRAGIVLLAAKSVEQKSIDSRIIRLASIMELVYYAVFVHNCIDEHNEKYNDLNNIENKIAVLVGDSLYTRAFFEVTQTLPINMFQIISELTLKMSLAEIKEEVLNTSSMSLEKYFEVVDEKTAAFFGKCCKLGASLVSAEESETMHLEKIGLNLGMIYQISIDFANAQLSLPANFNIQELSLFAENAEDSFRFIKDSIYKDKLTELIDYLLDHIKSLASYK
jgi:octaprenyl-diphosphate synthase